MNATDFKRKLAVDPEGAISSHPDYAVFWVERSADGTVAPLASSVPPSPKYGVVNVLTN